MLLCLFILKRHLNDDTELSGIVRDTARFHAYDLILSLVSTGLSLHIQVSGHAVLQCRLSHVSDAGNIKHKDSNILHHTSTARLRFERGSGAIRFKCSPSL